MVLGNGAHSAAYYSRCKYIPSLVCNEEIRTINPLTRLRLVVFNSRSTEICAYRFKVNISSCFARKGPKC